MFRREFCIVKGVASVEDRGRDERREGWKKVEGERVAECRDAATEG